MVLTQIGKLLLGKLLTCPPPPSHVQVNHTKFDPPHTPLDTNTTDFVIGQLTPRIDVIHPFTSPMPKNRPDNRGTTITTYATRHQVMGPFRNKSFAICVEIRNFWDTYKNLFLTITEGRPTQINGQEFSLLTSSNRTRFHSNTSFLSRKFLLTTTNSPHNNYLSYLHTITTSRTIHISYKKFIHFRQIIHKILSCMHSFISFIS